MSETTNPDARICAWSGQPFEGKGYVLKTTEHPEEIVSADALRAAPVDTAQQLDHLTAAVNRLTRRVAELEGNNAPEKAGGRTRKTAAPKVASHPEGA